MSDDDLQQGTIIINEVEASSRDEMVCPKCGQKSIEEHPSASEYPTKKAAILKASQCTNPECERELLYPDEVDKQYSPSGVKEQLFTKKSIIQALIAIIAVVVVASFFVGGNPLSTLFEDPTVTLEGSATNVNGEPLTDATVTLSDSDFETKTTEGEYQFEEVPVGEYMLSITPTDESESKAFAAKIEVTTDGINVIDDSVPEKLYSTENNTLTSTMPGDVTVSETFSAQNTDKTVTFIAEQNRESMNLELAPLDPSELQSTSTHTLNIGESTDLNVQGNIINSTITGEGNVTTEQFSVDQETDSSGRATLSINGTETPISSKLVLGEGAGSNTRTEELNIQSGGEKSIEVNGNVIDSVDMAIRGGATDAPKTQSGEWSPGSGPLQVTIGEEDAPSTTTLQFEGKITEESETITGTLSDKTEEITINTNGSINPTNSEITFTGGDLQSETVGTDSVEASGENGTEEITTEVKTVQKDGSYELDYDFNETNSSYVSGGYIVNGEKTELDSSSGTANINLNSGDTVGLWVKAEQEQLEQVNHSYNGPIEVTDVEVSDRSIDGPGSVGLRATVENTGSDPDYISVVAYKDGSTWDTGSADLSPGETKTITFDRVEFDSEGVYALQVNNSRVVEVTVGNGSLEYGEGSISSDLNYLAESGSVQVDSDGDGSTDCKAAVPGESCNLSLSSGDNTISLTQQNISNTQYEISYTARYGAKDIKADLDNDGEYELNHSGVLSDGNTISETITYPEGTHDISVTTGNNESVPYSLEWTQSGVIDSPTVHVNGTEVVNVDETYQGKREFSVDGDEFTDGTNTIKLSTNDSEEHTIIMNWSERGADTYPEVTLEENNTVLCSSREFAGDNSCSVDPDNLSPGNQTIVLTRDGQTLSEATFTFEHTAKSIPRNLELVNSDTGSTTLLTKTNAQTKNSDGSWVHSKEKDIDAGSTYTVESDTSSDLDLKGSVTIEATAERAQARNPTVTIKHADGSTSEVTVPEKSLNESGQLTEPVTITIPKDKFERGDNVITFTSENEGVYNVELVGVHDG